MKPILIFAVLAAAGYAAYIYVFSRSDNDSSPTAPPPAVAADGELGFAFVDVAGPLGYTMRNRTGKSGVGKEYILEAMPPGVAVADFDGDGFMDLYCPNGNKIQRYDNARDVIHLLPSAEAPRNELYWSDKGQRFQPGAKAAGVDDEHWGFGAIAADFDNDGDPDIYVTNFGPNVLYRNDGGRKFTDVSAATGASGNPRDWSAGACAFDYDRDGDLDIYIAQYADVHDLMRDATITTILPDGKVFGRNCDWKGLKVYCGPLGIKPLNDVLLRNDLAETGKLGFTDVSKAAGIELPYNALSATESSAGPFYAFQPVAADLDGDGWQDVFVANDSVPNACWLNRKDGTFTNRATRMGLAVSMTDHTAQASMGVGMNDWNGDGVPDIAITEFSHDQFNLLLGERLPNGHTVFNEKAAKNGLRDITFKKLGWGTVMQDFDLDGDTDLFFACGHVYPEVDTFPSQETSYRQTNLLVLNIDARRARIKDVSALAGPGLAVEKCSRAAVAFDFDNDGDMDIATTELNDTPALLRCDIDRTAGPRHWLQIRLIGDPGQKVPLDPAGSLVRLRAGKLRASRIHFIGSSFQSSEDPRLHFGLGKHTKVDELEVTWTNGQKTVLRDVDVDQLLTIRYGKPDNG